MLGLLVGGWAALLSPLAMSASHLPKPMPQKLVIQNGHTGQVTALAFSPDSKFLATGSTDQTIKLWDPQSGQLLSNIVGNEVQVTSLEFSPDGKYVASGGRDIKLWDVTSGQLAFVLKPSEMGVDKVAFSPDGRVLASVSEDWDEQAQRHIGTILLWDVASRQLSATLHGHAHEIKAIAFSPDGRQLASVSWDKTIKLWDVRKRTLEKTLTGHTKGIMTVAYSADGKYLASGGWDMTAKLGIP